MNRAAVLGTHRGRCLVAASTEEPPHRRPLARYADCLAHRPERGAIRGQRHASASFVVIAVHIFGSAEIEQLLVPAHILSQRNAQQPSTSGVTTPITPNCIAGRSKGEHRVVRSRRSGSSCSRLPTHRRAKGALGIGAKVTRHATCFRRRGPALPVASRVGRTHFRARLC